MMLVITHDEVSWFLLAVAAAFNAVPAVTAKYRLNHLGRLPLLPLRDFACYLIRFLRSPFIWLAAILFMISPVLWLISINHLRLGIVYPSFYALSFFFIYLLSVLVLHEDLTPRKISGALLMLIAFYLFYNA